MRHTITVAVTALIAFTAPLASQAPTLLTEYQKLRLPITANFSGVRGWSLTDINNDGAPDLIVGANGISADLSARLLLNDGTGRFTDVTSTHLPDIRGKSWGMTTGDVNGDGHVDMFFGHWENLFPGHGSKLLINDGTGRFNDETWRFHVSPGNQEEGGALQAVWQPLLLDIDGDGDLDMVSCHAGFTSGAIGIVAFWMNDGTGRFTLDPSRRFPNPPLLRPRGATLKIIPWDLDRDGHVDLLICTSDTWGVFLRNRGNGYFDDVSHARIVSDFSRMPWLSATVGDINSDGFEDIVVSDGYPQLMSTISVYGNDGRGRFHDVTSHTGIQHIEAVYDLALVDLDLDGDLDLLVGADIYVGVHDGESHVYRNDGTGRFTLDTAAFLPLVKSGGSRILIADIDRDGDPDIVLPEIAGGLYRLGRPRVYANRTRQLHAPATLNTWTNYPLELHGPPNGIATVALGLAPAHLPIGSLGILGIDPALLWMLPGSVTLNTHGAGSKTLQIPANPTLIGITVLTQALVADSAFLAPRLTNAMSDIVR